MQRRTLLIIIGSLVAVFSVGALAFWVIGLMDRQAALFEADTLQKLTFCAEINADQSESYARTLLALKAPNVEARELYRNEAEEFTQKTGRSISHYSNLVQDNTSKSRILLNQMITARERYVDIQSQVFTQLAHNRNEAANQISSVSLWPAYQQYTHAGDLLFANDVAAGKVHAEEVRGLAMKVKFIAASLCVLLFLGGLAAPFLFLFGLLNWLDASVVSDRGY